MVPREPDLHRGARGVPHGVGERLLQHPVDRPVDREAARSQERARIAQEIHDSVGHHASLIAVSAAALSASTTDPASKESAEKIHELAKCTLSELCSALGLIDVAAGRPGSDAESTALVAGARVAGVCVDVEQDGEPLELRPAVAARTSSRARRRSARLAVSCSRVVMSRPSSTGAAAISVVRVAVRTQRCQGSDSE